MQPINMDLFIQKMEEVVNDPNPLDEKLNTLADLIKDNEESFTTQQNPLTAGKFEALAERISAIQTGDNDQLSRIGEITTSLRSYAEDFRFPKEVMDTITRKAAQSQTFAETANLRKVSKEVRKQEALAFEGELTKRNIRTAQQAIEFAKEFGPPDAFGNPGLTYLDIQQILFTNAEFEELLKYLPNLKTLICPFIRSVGSIIAAAPTLQQLEHLEAPVRMTDEGLIAIINSPFLKKLKSLALPRVGESAIAAVAQSDLRLQSLKLVVNNDDEVIAITRSEKFNLHNLELAGSFSERGVAAIAQSKHLKLKRLCLNKGVADAGVKMLADSGNLKDLEELILSGEIGDAGAQAIVESFSKLQTLNLAKVIMGEAGCRTLADRLVNIKEFSYVAPQISDKGLIALLTSQNPAVRNGVIWSREGFGEKGQAAIKLSKSISSLTAEQMNRLFDKVAQLAKQAGKQIDENEKEWGRFHLFDNAGYFYKALDDVLSEEDKPSIQIEDVT